MKRPRGIVGWLVVGAMLALLAGLIGSCPRPHDADRPLNEQKAHGPGHECDLCRERWRQPFTRAEAVEHLRSQGKEPPKGAPTSSAP